MHDRSAGCGEVRDLPARERGGAGALLLCLDRLAAGVIAADREAEAVLEVEAAHLAVADDIETDLLLQFEVPLRARLRDAGKILGAHLSRLEGEARLFPVRRPQQAADHVGADAIEGHQSCLIPAAFTAAA